MNKMASSPLYKDRVLLVVPPEIYFKQEKDSTAPLHLIQLAAVLRDEGFTVRIVDATAEGLKLPLIERAMKEFLPGTVGITSTTWNRFDAFETAKCVKTACPGAEVVYGGPHATFTAEDTLTHIPWIDHVAAGEGEQTLPEICGRVLRGETMENVAGCTTRKNGQIVNGGPRALIDDLGALPYPAYDLVNLPVYRQNLLPGSPLKVITMVSSRGCPLNCQFCSVRAMWGKSFRYKKAGRVCDEIEMLQKNYGYEGVWFYDDTFTLNKKRVLDLLDEIKKRRMKFSWFAETRVDCVDFDLLKQMREAGCCYMAFGIESISQKVLDSIQKQITVEEIKTRLDYCRQLGIRVKAFFIFGNLDERFEEGLETVNFIRENGHLIQDRAITGATGILPGTDVEKIAVERKLHPKDFSWSQYFFENKNLSLGRSPFIPLLIQPQMGFKELLHLKYAYYGKEHYPFTRLVGKLKEATSLAGFKKLIFSGMEFLKWRFGY